MTAEAFDYTQLDEIVLFDGKGDLIELERAGRFINLIKPSEFDKKYYRFDLNEKRFERVNFYKTREDKVTPVKTENITRWFKDCRMVTKDLHFGRLIVFAKYNTLFSNYRSPVRFVEQLGHKIILSIEQWEALGLQVDPVDDFFGKYLESIYCYGKSRDLREWIFTQNEKLLEPKTAIGVKPYIHYSDYIDVLPGELSKDLLNYIKNNYKRVSRNELRNLRDNYNDGEYLIEKELKRLGQDPEFTGVFHYTTTFRYRGNNPRRWAFGSSSESRRVRTNLVKAVKDYHLDPIALMRWLKKQANVEKNDVGYLFGSGDHYRDYLNCEFELCDGSYSKMQKYPDNFRTEFHKKQEEYSAKIAEIDEKKFKRIGLENQNLKYEDKNYIIEIPMQTQEIHHEALILGHCVRTYIPKVIDGQTLILFLRLKKFPDEPLVTLEVKNNTLTQAFGKNDSKPTAEELQFLKKYVTAKNLRVGCWNEELLP